MPTTTFVDKKTGKTKTVPKLSPTAKKAAAKKAGQKRTLKRRQARFALMPSIELFPLAKMHYGLPSPKMMFQTGKPIKKGEVAKAKAVKKLRHNVAKKPAMAMPFLEGLFGKKK